MGVSRLSVSHDVEGEYTLLELLALLGAPKKAQEVLKQLEESTRRNNLSIRELNKREADRSAQVIADKADLGKIMEQADDRVKKAVSAESRVVAARTSKRDEMDRIGREIESSKDHLRILETDLLARETKLAKSEEFLEGQHRVLKEELETARKEIAKDVKAAEKYRQEALKIRREADDKVEAMKALVMK